MLETILGIVGMYVFVHSTIIIAKKIENLTQYEKVVLIVALVFFVLIILGLMSS